MKLHFCSALLSLAFVSQQATATEEYYQQLDSNSDGFISIKEAIVEPALLASFGDIDKNRDGKITRNEFLKSKLASELAKHF